MDTWPESETSRRIREAAERLRRMTMAERLALLVKAGALTRAQADRALARLEAAN